MQPRFKHWSGDIAGMTQVAILLTSVGVKLMACSSRAGRETGRGSVAPPLPDRGCGGPLDALITPARCGAATAPGRTGAPIGRLVALPRGQPVGPAAGTHALGGAPAVAGPFVLAGRAGAGCPPNEVRMVIGQS